MYFWSLGVKGLSSSQKNPFILPNLGLSESEVYLVYGGLSKPFRSFQAMAFYVLLNGNSLVNPFCLRLENSRVPSRTTSALQLQEALSTTREQNEYATDYTRQWCSVGQV